MLPSEVDHQLHPSATPRRRPYLASISAAAILFALSACNMFEEKGPVKVAAIGEFDAQANLAKDILSPPTTIFFDATAQGLIGFDGSGQIVPGLAERWTVTTDGRSYIFRIRDAEWPDGKPVTAQQVAAVLRSYIAPSSRHALANDFAEIEDIRAMTDEVIEIRLKVPQPLLLELLAQPSMAIASRSKNLHRGWGPMRVQAQGKNLRFTPDAQYLSANLATSDEEAAEKMAADPANSIEMVATTAPRALARFKNGHADAVIGGSFNDLPYFKSSGISRLRLQVDPTIGLFGLAFTNDQGFLAEPAHRAAISALIRRDRLLGAFVLADWTIQQSLRPPAPPRSSLPAPQLPSWANTTDSERLAVAQRLVTAWKAKGHDAPAIRIALPDSLGAKILFAYVAADLKRAGISAERVPLAARADLRLIDEISPNEDPIWSLRRLNCRTDTLCNADIAAQISKANAHIDSAQRLALIEAAEGDLQAQTPFIPIANPLRWTVSSQRLTGLTPNIRAHHPLNRLIAAPK
jgi:oligopeptide transport system substrate-binding protein